MSEFKVPPPKAPKRKHNEIETSSSIQLPDVELTSQRVLQQLTPTSLRKLLLALQKHISKNIEDRMRFPDQPEKFMDSEIDVDEDIKQLQVLATAPELYPDFVNLHGAEAVLSLLGHENPDIVIDTVDLLSELTEPDVVTESGEKAMVLIDNLVENNIMELVLGTMSKLDESQEEEAKGIHSCLSIFENLAEIKPEICEIAAEKTKIVQWLLERVNKVEYHPNKLYAAELLAIFMHASDKVKRMFDNEKTMEQLLKAIAVYRKQKPSGIEEEELLENLFDCVCYALILPELQTTFRKVEGIELMLLMIRKKSYARKSALKVLAYALTNNKENCNQFVARKGLKTLFAVFMNKHKKKSKSKEDTADHDEHVLSIISSLFKYLDEDKLERLKKKFSENEFEKTDRLMEHYQTFHQRVVRFDRKVREGLVNMNEDQLYLERLDAGYFGLQQICIMLGYISTNEDIKKRIALHLNQRSLSLQDVIVVLKDYIQNAESDEEKKRVSELLKNLT